MHLDAGDHDAPVRRAIDLAEEAAGRGDDPFGSVLVRDGEIRIADAFVRGVYPGG